MTEAYHYIAVGVVENFTIDLFVAKLGNIFIPPSEKRLTSNQIPIQRILRIFRKVLSDSKDTSCYSTIDPWVILVLTGPRIRREKSNKKKEEACSDSQL
ncbi:hypothetical protein AVEN_97474-1 [Araneus ventricosus]|uniref:Uncharacterized protein n=1 Tax=Araneus ventricosus TaxID=182803 RepID=A0A4Y2LZW0_ARAVE|nr:hypothetical protein AVEN_97474-1 [Araneus ventricosus]